MRVLLVESTPGSAREVAAWLNEAGHESSSCFDTPVTFGCRGVATHDDCPLEQPTDVAILVRDLDHGGHTLTEMGAVCAMRHRVPVVEIVEPATNELDSIMLAALEGAQHHTAHLDYVLAVREQLHHVPDIGDPSRINISITRAGGRVHAMLRLPDNITEKQLPLVVDWVGRALRQHDPYARIIDVGVSR